MTKRNTTAPVHVGLCAVLARCPIQPLSSGKEEEDEDKDKDKDKNEDKEEKGEAQESDKDLY